MSRTAVLFVLVAACAGRTTDEVDPDLVQPMAAAPAEEELPPDERIDKPDAPGVDLIGENDRKPRGKTQHVVIEDEASPEDQVVAQPKRKKSGSFLGGIGMNPNK